MTRIESKRGMLALMLAHCAGMVDLVALPVWVGTLISYYRFDPQQAGGLATLFLIGASIASVFFAPRFNRTNAKWATVIGFALATLSFVISSQTQNFGVLAGLHLFGGIAAGTALSMTHGTMGYAANPQRVFGLAGLVIGLFGIAFLGGSQGIIKEFGGNYLFILLAAVMILATIATFFFFPKPTRALTLDDGTAENRLPPLGKAVWYCMIGVAILAMTQAMTLSFYERIGMTRGFGHELVTLALIFYGIVTIFPAPLAALMEKRVHVLSVLCFGPLFQAIFAMLASHTHEYVLFAIAGPMMAFTILFVHTFAFGYLARLDPTGRAVAATPAMLMIGAAVGPFLGGTLVKFISFEAIGYAACILVALEVWLFSKSGKSARQEQKMDATPADKTVLMPE